MSAFGFLRRTTRRLYNQFQNAGADSEVERIRTVLSQTSAFRTCSFRALGAVASAMHPRTYKAGEVLYYENDPGLGLYVIEKGQVRLCADCGNERMEMRTVGPNEMFGVLSLIGDFRRIETAEAITEVNVFGLFRPDLNSLMNRNPKATIETLQALTELMGRQYVDLMGVIADRDGDEIALQSYAEASTRAATPPPTSTP